MADISIIKFQLGGINFCIYADRILEIVRYTGVRRIPKPLPYVVGLIELRKRIVVVVDFRKRLGLSPILLSKDTVMIVAYLSGGMTGILVESISDFKRISDKMILPPIPIAGFPEQLLCGVLPEEDDIILVPDLDKIFSSYINIRLVPINPSEKIAFQHRFTPGSLARTLENNLLNQQYIEYEVVRKLPRSLCLPSIAVHKMTSYYPDFQPQKHSIERKDRRQVLPQKLRAGDEKYFSLSQQLLLQQRRSIHEGRAEKDDQDSKTDMPNVLIPDPHTPIPNLLEDILHTVESSQGIFSKPRRTQSDFLTSQANTGRHIAKTLRISPTHITKYFTYYKSSSTKRAEPESNHVQFDQPLRLYSGQALEERLRELLKKDHRPEGESIHSHLLRTLQLLHDGQYALTQRHIKKICVHYQASSVKIAKLASFFPEYFLALKTEVELLHFNGEVDDSTSSNSLRTEINGQKPPTKEEGLSEPQISNLEPYVTSVSECIRYLAEEDKLSEDPYVRYVASRMRVPTCRLSKLRSYYRWNNE